jgi:AAA+ ATPase superfamily predicted ATPase
MRPSNPYIAGNPVRGQEKFIGRADVLRDVERTLRHPDENAIVLFGQRRIGKTSVLLNVERELAAKQEYTPIYFDLQDKAALPLAEVLYQMAQKSPSSPKPRCRNGSSLIQRRLLPRDLHPRYGANLSKSRIGAAAR